MPIFDRRKTLLLGVFFLLNKFSRPNGRLLSIACQLWFGLTGNHFSASYKASDFCWQNILDFPQHLRMSHMYGRWTSDEHGLKPDKIERLDDLPLPHIRLWAASSSSSGGFQILVLEITCSDHGSVTLCDYQRAWDQKRSKSPNLRDFCGFAFCRWGTETDF